MLLRAGTEALLVQLAFLLLLLFQIVHPLLLVLLFEHLELFLLEQRGQQQLYHARVDFPPLEKLLELGEGVLAAKLTEVILLGSLPLAHELIEFVEEVRSGLQTETQLEYVVARELVGW